jgi:hypothetical protein
MPEGSQRPQRFCRNSGAEIRPGTRFCVSCGIPLNQGSEGPAPAYSEPSTLAPVDSLV